MGKVTNPIKRGIRKTNSVVKKKKLNQVLRKVTNEICNSSNTITTRAEADSCNTSGKMTSLLSPNYKIVDAKSLKTKNKKKVDNFQASVSKDVNTWNIKANSIPVVPHLRSKFLTSLSPNESSKSEVNNKDPFSIKEEKSKHKTIENKVRGVGKKMQKNVKSGARTNFSNGVAEKCEVIEKDNFVSPTMNSCDEFQKDPKPTKKNKTKCFLERRNPKDVRSSEINENLNGGQVTDSQSYSGERKNRGKDKCSKNSVFENGSLLPSLKELKLSDDNNSSMDSNTQSSQTSLCSKEEEDENILENTTLVNGMGDASVESISSPICIEMHGDKYVAPNLFSNSMSNYQRQAGKRVFDEIDYSLWRLVRNSREAEKMIHFAMNEDGILGSSLPKTTQDEMMKGYKIQPKNTRDVFSGGSVNPVNVTPHLFFKISKNKVLLMLPPDKYMYFSGVIKLKVLIGAIEVLGYQITSASGTQTVYSPWQDKMILIQSIQFYDSPKKYYDCVRKVFVDEFKDVIPVPLDILNSLPAFSNFIVLEQEEHSILPRFLNKYIPSCFMDVLKTGSLKDALISVSSASFINAPLSEGRRALQTYKEWVKVGRKIFTSTDSPRIMVFGGKGVGKSSFLHVLINRTIRSTKRILYIDLDPGQCEFTPPGCISAVIVEKPLLGPNFTHFIDPERCVFIGRVDVAKCPSEYVECVKYILNWCNEEKSVENIPWFINTMGFSKGIGVDLALATIRSVHPTNLIQFITYDKKVDFEIQFTSHNINSSLIQSPFSCQTRVPDYEYHLLRSGGPYKIRRKASFLRELAVLSYFSKMVLGFKMSLLESNVFEFPFNNLKLCICHEKVNYSYYLSAMNGNVVGLCTVAAHEGLTPNDPSYPQILVKPPICDCYGLGIVRGVDMKEKRVFIASPLTPLIIGKVNCLVLGEVFLPEIAYTKQNNTNRHIPYVVVGSNNSSLERSSQKTIIV